MPSTVLLIVWISEGLTPTESFCSPCLSNLLSEGRAQVSESRERAEVSSCQESAVRLVSACEVKIASSCTEQPVTRNLGTRRSRGPAAVRCGTVVSRTGCNTTHTDSCLCWFTADGRGQVVQNRSVLTRQRWKLRAFSEGISCFWCHEDEPWWANPDRS